MLFALVLGLINFAVIVTVIVSFSITDQNRKFNFKVIKADIEIIPHFDLIHSSHVLFLTSVGVIIPLVIT